VTDIPPQTALFNSLVIYGPMGLMLIYFMFRGEKFSENVVKELRTLAHRIDGLTRAMLVDTVSRDSTGPHAKQKAQEMLNAIEARNTPRGS
jgi:hypothetical protein